MRALLQAGHFGRLGLQESLISIEAEGARGGPASGLVLSSLRLTKAGKLSLRLYDVAGEARRARVRAATGISSAVKTRLDGEAIARLELGDGGTSFSVEIAPFEIVTVEIEAARSSPTLP